MVNTDFFIACVFVPAGATYGEFKIFADEETAKESEPFRFEDAAYASPTKSVDYLRYL